MLRSFSVSLPVSFAAGVPGPGGAASGLAAAKSSAPREGETTPADRDRKDFALMVKTPVKIPVKTRE